jgi:hypothetical protein
MTYASAWAQSGGKAAIWIVTTDASPIYREVAETLRVEVERLHPVGIEWLVVPAKEFESATSAPRLIVTVGSGAFAAVVTTARASEKSPPILATLLPRVAFDRDIARAPQKLQASAVLLDQPPARQAALIRAALPTAKRIGLLLGPESKPMLSSVQTALGTQGLATHAEDVTQQGMFAALQNLLDDSDALLALADPAVFNSETVASILTAGYRRKVPLIAFSAAYVKAGALLAIYATPEQVARDGARVVGTVLAGLPLPAPATSSEFTIGINAVVARSLGLSLNEDELRRQIRREEGKP